MHVASSHEGLGSPEIEVALPGHVEGDFAHKNAFCVSPARKITHKIAHKTELLCPRTMATEPEEKKTAALDEGDIKLLKSYVKHCILR
jgi:hypothetical protein